MRAILWLDTTRPYADVVAVARHAAELGWDGIRVRDAAAGGECWTLAGALAVTVPDVRLEVVTDDARDRHPAVVAKLASTVDRLSGGRLLVGLTPASDPSARDRLAEEFLVVKSLAGQDRSSYRGSFYQLRDAPLNPKPQQQPFPLLLVGGDGELAAAVADHWSVTTEAEDVGAEIAALREACRRRGRDPAEVTVAAPYPARGGVDEWVVPESALGNEQASRTEALTRILAQARAAT